MKDLSSLVTILKDGEKLGLNFGEIYQKIEHVQETMADEKIKIVLLSSFSDGKTSTIAGLNGKIEPDMKIDVDESSDEIIVYHPQGLASGFEIMDTPGLFGSKEKEIDGDSIRLSAITEKYISEAHIILYICDAVTPLKESHAKFIEKVMRKFGKLNSTIFVINKMDEAGYDLMDEEDFLRGVTIKTNNLKQRLKDTIRLTPNEEQQLRVVCIAADPKGKGLEYWFAKMDNYKQRSHIEDLRKCIDELVTHSDIKALRDSTEEAAITDIVCQTSDAIQVVYHSLESTMTKVREKNQEMEQDLSLLRKDLSNSRQEMQDRLNALKDGILSDINSASMDSFEQIVEQRIGVNNGQISFYVLDRAINQIVQDCSEENDVAIKTRVTNIENHVTFTEKLLTEGLQKGAIAIKGVKISGETVKAVRDVVAKEYKFKPWGAIKLGAKFTKAMPYIGAAIELGVAYWQRKKEKKALAEFEATKGKIKDAVSDKIGKIFECFNNNENYYKNFAPSYLQLEKQVREKEETFQGMQNILTQLHNFDRRIKNWMQENAEDVDFEEIIK